MNKYECISTNINEYQYISTNIHKYRMQYTYQEISTSINKCQQIWKKIKRSMTNEQNEQISTTTTKQISTNIWLKYLALGPVALPSEFVLCEYYVKTHYMAPKASSQAPATLEQPTEAVSQYISTNINTYRSHINTYQQISSNINKYECQSNIKISYQQISIHIKNINTYQILNINKYECISTNINKYQYISTNINTYQQIYSNIK